MKFMFVFLTFLMPAWAASSTLTQDPDSIPYALHALDKTLSQETIQNIQWVFKGLSFANPKVGLDQAHVVWRFMASLQASGDEKALSLYNNILQSGYEGKNDWLQRIGHTWGKRAMNQAEQRILKASQTFKVLAGQSHRDAYLNCLVPARLDPLDIPRLPILLWPEDLIQENIDSYITKSRLSLLMPNDEIRKGVKNLVFQWGSNWRAEASINETFLWHSTPHDTCGNTYCYGYTASLWATLCRKTCHIDWPSFKAWGQQWTHNVAPQNISHRWGAAISIYTRFGGDTQNIEKGKKWLKQCGINLDTADNLLSGLQKIEWIYVLLKGDNNKWKNFWDWSQPHLVDIERNFSISTLFLLYYSFDGDDERIQNFVQLCEPYWKNLPDKNKYIIAGNLRMVYDDYKMEEHLFQGFPVWLNSSIIKRFGIECCRNHMWSLCNLYKKLNGNEDDIERFMHMCNPLLQAIKNRKNSQASPNAELSTILKIYENFAQHNSDIKQLEKYIQWMLNFVPYTDYNNYDPIRDTTLIYNTFNGEEDKIEAFLKWYGTHIGSGETPPTLPGIPNYWHPLLHKRYNPNNQWSFCLDGIDDALYAYHHLKDQPQSFENLKNKPWFSSCEFYYRSYILRLFANTRTLGLAEDFVAYMDWLYPTNNYDTSRFIKISASAYAGRTYLRYIRAVAAYRAAGSPRAMQPYFETDVGQKLPTIQAGDQNMAHFKDLGEANAHDFDSIYPVEHEKLVNMCQEKGYVHQQDEHLVTIYNKQEIEGNHPINKEVRDFLTFVSENFDSPKASIIFQVLGIQPKASTTSDGFGSYLGRSMYFGKPNAPKGDDFLGQAWWYIKEVAKEKSKTLSEADAKKEMLDLKRSLANAILNSTEVHGKYVHTNCQTRITGELMKVVCWHIPGSDLRSLIASDDSLTIDPNEHKNIELQIATAKKIAIQKFKAIEEGPNVKLLYSDGNKPELWRLIEAIYADLYCQTQSKSGLYAHNEHTLTRDGKGRLVRAYQPDGTLRTTPEIVYSQLQFTVLEKTFTDLVNQKYIP